MTREEKKELFRQCEEHIEAIANILSVIANVEDEHFVLNMHKTATSCGVIAGVKNPKTGAFKDQFDVINLYDTGVVVHDWEVL